MFNFMKKIKMRWILELKVSLEEATDEMEFEGDKENTSHYKDHKAEINIFVHSLDSLEVKNFSSMLKRMHLNHQGFPRGILKVMSRIMI